MDQQASPEHPAYYCVSVDTPGGGVCIHRPPDQAEALVCALRTFQGLPWRIVRVEDTGIAAETTPIPDDETAFARLVRALRERIKDA